MQSLKNKIEAILYSAGKKISIEEIAKLSNTSTAMAHQALTELKKDYGNRDTSLNIIDEGNAWKIIVKDEHLPIVKKIVSETEISKTIMETLAVIAFKYPIKQSDLIKIRTNKAYDHLKELEEIGYITRQKYGRSKLIKLTQKFFEYFDLPESQLKEKFQDFQSIARAIEDKEKEIESLKQERLEKSKQEKDQDQQLKEEVQKLDENETNIPSSEDKITIIEEDQDEIKQTNQIQVYEKEQPKEEISDSEQIIKNLEIVDEPPESEIRKENQRIQKIQEEDKIRSMHPPTIDSNKASDSNIEQEEIPEPDSGEKENNTVETDSIEQDTKK